VVTRRAAGILIGGATAVALAVMATLLARRLWPAYAAVEPSRTYSVGMLVVRLTVGAVCTATAASVATRVARDRGRAAWVLGALPAGTPAARLVPISGVVSHSLSHVSPAHRWPGGTANGAMCSGAGGS